MTIFLLKLTLCWGFFALLYALLLRQETFFRANRAYLLGTAALGILLAALPAEQMPVPDSGIDVIDLPEFAVGMQQVETAAATWKDLPYMWVLYWAGFALMALRASWGLIRIVQMAGRGKSEHWDDGCLLVHTAEAKVPFSFFKWVFVPTSLKLSVPNSRDELSESSQGKEQSLMLSHERAHARGWHSLDVLLAEALCIVFWFHPLAHWYRRALRTVHEYLADAEASRHADIKQYGLLLIGQSQSGMPVAFANHFFQSPLKQRLVMLTKKESAPFRAFKFGLLVPLALLFALLFRQAPAIAQAVDEKHLAFVHELESRGWEMTDTVVTFNPETYEEKVQIVRNSAAPEKDQNGKLVYQYAEIQPQFPGGQEALMKFLSDHIKYPEKAQQNRIEGTVVVSFIVDETGQVTQASGKIDLPNDNNLPLVEEAIRVVQSMPKWTPAYHKGKAVRCSLCLPVKFKLDEVKAKVQVVDPEFPGGVEALMKFLTENIHYPEAARKANAEGMVVLKFVVQEDGSLANIQNAAPDKPLHPDLVAEAIRVVQSMPKWKPGLKDGKVVKTEFALPIRFRL